MGKNHTNYVAGQQLSDNVELIDLGEEEGDESIVKEAEAALKSLQAEAARRQVEAMLSGEAGRA